VVTVFELSISNLVLRYKNTVSIMCYVVPTEKFIYHTEDMLYFLRKLSSFLQFGPHAAAVRIAGETYVPIDVCVLAVI
jgi:hypothetical protein